MILKRKIKLGFIQLIKASSITLLLIVDKSQGMLQIWIFALECFSLLLFFLLKSNETMAHSFPVL